MTFREIAQRLDMHPTEVIRAYNSGMSKIFRWMADNPAMAEKYQSILDLDKLDPVLEEDTQRWLEEVELYEESSRLRLLSCEGEEPAPAKRLEGDDFMEVAWMYTD